MRSVRKLATAVPAALCALALTSAPAWAGSGYESVTGSFGGPGSGPGQFNEPTSVAVNDETGDVYVLDSGNDRVERFSAEGAGFEGQFNGSGEYEVAGKKETGTPAEAGKFLEPANVAVDNSCASQTPALTGVECETFDPSNGDVYVADVGHDVIDKFSASGEYESQLSGFPNRLPPALLSVAVDNAGDVWVGGAFETVVYEFGAVGDLKNEFRVLEGVGVPAGFAVDSTGDVYTVPGNNRVDQFNTATENTRAVIEEHPKLPPVTLAIISSTGDLLVDQGSTIELFKSPLSAGISPLLTFPGTGLSESAGIAVNGAGGEGTIYATQRGANNVEYFAPGEPEAPKVVSESAKSVATEFGEFSAVIDPGNRKTTYFFEFSESKEAVENGKGTPVTGGTLLAEFGDEEAHSAPEAEFFRPSHTFYYRVVAENELSKGSPTYGPVQPYTKLPLVAGEKFADLTSTSAKLEATINPEFETARYWFEYATEEAAQLGTPNATVVGTGDTSEGSEPEPISTDVSSLIPGQTYYYRVVTKNAISIDPHNINEGKLIVGEIKEVKPYAPPAIITGGAQNITHTSATLSGDVDPEGTEAKYYFAYIDGAGYESALEGGAQEKANPYAEGSTTVPIAIGPGEASLPVGPIPADGLLPGETYHYALVATSKFELQTIGLDRTFTTQAATPPLVSTGAAGNVSQNSATLSGTVTTNGLQTNYGFEIGTAPGNYGPATGLGAIGGSLTEEVSVTLGELQPGTTYYYRVTATNADGTSQGQPQSFATPGFPTLLNAPSSLQQVGTPGIAFPAVEEATGGGTTRALTKGEKLAKALKACRKDRGKGKRAKCEKQARSKYGEAKPKPKGKKR